MLPLVLLVSIALACNDHGVEIYTRTVPARTPVLAATGIEQLDATLDTVSRGDVIAMAGLAGYQRAPCAEVTTEGGPPACRAGEAAGDLVEVLPFNVDCVPGWARPEDVPARLREAVGLRRDALAVYRPALSAFGEEYVAVFRTLVLGRPPEDPPGVALAIRDGRLVSVETDCDGIAALYAPDRVAEFIVEPRVELLDDGTESP
jgi:hypothetical protein